MLMTNYSISEVIDHYGIEFIEKLQDVIDASEKRHPRTPYFRRTCPCPAIDALRAIPIFGKPPRSQTEAPYRFDPDRDGDQHP
jgi:hypothetical protein